MERILNFSFKKARKSIHDQDRLIAPPQLPHDTFCTVREKKMVKWAQPSGSQLQSWMKPAFLHFTVGHGIPFIMKTKSCNFPQRFTAYFIFVFFPRMYVCEKLFLASSRESVRRSTYSLCGPRRGECAWPTLLHAPLPPGQMSLSQPFSTVPLHLKEAFCPTVNENRTGEPFRRDGKEGGGGYSMSLHQDSSLDFLPPRFLTLHLLLLRNSAEEFPSWRSG